MKSIKSYHGKHIFDFNVDVKIVGVIEEEGGGPWRAPTQYS